MGMLSVVVLFAVCASVRGLSRIDPLVSTNRGLIRGLQFGDGYAKFLGIPYAVVDENNPFGVSLVFHLLIVMFIVCDTKILPLAKLLCTYKGKSKKTTLSPNTMLIDSLYE